MADNYVALRIRATDEAKPDLDDLKLKLDELKDKVATARAEVDDAQADVVLADLDAKLEAVSKKVASPRIDMAGATRAAAQITAVQAEMDKLDETAAASAAEQEAAAASTGKAAEESGGAWAAMGEKTKMALVGVGIGAALAVKGAADFQAQTTRLVTSAGESAKNLNMVRQGMLAISAATATSTSEMAAGMYTVESAGFHGAAGLQVLRAAAQGAKDEGAELATVSNAVTDVLVDFHMKASQSADATSQLIAAVSHGKTTFEEFAGSMSNVLPLAASLHLKLADVTGVLAEMTAHGMSARQASMDEANAMRELMKPNAAMVKEFTALGISADEVYHKLGSAGLAGTMQWLSGVAHKGAGEIGQNYTQALGKLMGTAPGLVTALMTTGKNAGDTDKAIRGIAHASADAKGNVDGFSTVSQTAAFKMAAAKESIMAAGISLGQVLLPAVTAVLGPISHMLQVIAGNKAAAIAFSVVVGGVLAGALGGKLAKSLKDSAEGIKSMGDGIGWLIGKLTAQTAVTEAQAAATETATGAQEGLNLAFLTSPIGLIIEGIVLLVVAFVELWKHSAAFRDFWKDVWHDILVVVDAAVGFIRDHWRLILDILIGPVGMAVLFIIGHWHTIMHGASEAVDWIRDHWKLLLAILTGPIGVATLFIVDHWHQILSGAQHMADDVVSFFRALPGRILSAVGNLNMLLYNAGRNVIAGLINGVKSMIGDVGNAVSSVVDTIKSYLPFSPARRGPLSGSGAPEVSGRAIARNIARGITGGVGDVTAAMEHITGAVAPHGGYGAFAAGTGGKLDITLTMGPGALLKAMQVEVRAAGGDPAMFQKKVAYR